METGLGYRQAYVSQQLAILREAGIVCDHRDGLNIFYSVKHPVVFSLLDTARSMVAAPTSITIPVSPIASCACPKCTGAEGAAC